MPTKQVLTDLEVSGQISGQAVQQSAADDTAGRLALSEHVLLLANLTGTIASGNAVFETDSNANGEFTKLQSGLMFMSSPVFLTPVTFGGSGIYYSAEQTWTFPATATAILAAGVTSTGSTLNGGNVRTNGTTSATWRGTRLGVSSASDQAFRCWAIGKF